MTPKPSLKRNREGVELCAFDGCSRQGRFSPEILCPGKDGVTTLQLYIKVCKDHASSPIEKFAGRNIWPELVKLLKKAGKTVPPYRSIGIQFTTDAGIVIGPPRYNHVVTLH
jgi:hypothetical protein